MKIAIDQWPVYLKPNVCLTWVYNFSVKFCSYYICHSKKCLIFAKLENISLWKSVKFREKIEGPSYWGWWVWNFQTFSKIWFYCSFQKYVLFTLLLFSNAFIKVTNARSIIETKQQVQRPLISVTMVRHTSNFQMSKTLLCIFN